MCVVAIFCSPFFFYPSGGGGGEFLRSIRIENTLIRALQMNTPKRFAIVFWVPCFVRFDFSSHKLKCVLYTNGKFALAPHTQTHKDSYTERKEERTAEENRTQIV